MAQQSTGDHAIVSNTHREAQNPQENNTPSMDQMVQDIISKATAQYTPLTPSNQFNQPQNQLASQPHSMPHWNPSGISVQPMHHDMHPPQVPPSSSSQTFPYTVDPSNPLPQDILHILQSDFASDSPDTEAQKNQQISRVAEELRVKVRLSRYRRVRDQRSDSEDEDCQRREGIDTSDSDSEDDSEESNEDNLQIDPQADDEADLIDGSGDEEEEREKNNKALAKLKAEIEQIIGIPQGPDVSPEVDKCMTEAINQEDPNEPVAQTEIEMVPGTQERTQTQTAGEAQDATNVESIEGNSATTADLLAKVMSQIDKLNNGPTIPPITASETCPNEEPLPSDSSQIVTPAGRSTTTSTVDATQSEFNSLPKPQASKAAPKKLQEDLLDSGDESEDEEQGSTARLTGPTTAHELIEPPSEVTEVPFTRVPQEAMKSISIFGSITSLIGNVLVIQGTAGLGYDRVLDEGTLVCQKHGLVIGKIFETFGSVTNPHYSIRLPNHILARTTQDDDEWLDLSPGLSLYYLPTHSNFVFTAELKAQPKGTDASNLYDEEVECADEIEFSDDEAEAAYRQACKAARRAARDPNHSRGGHSKHQQRNPAQVSENGRRMFVKMPADKLNYGADDSNTQGRSGAFETDYSLLQRPRELTTGNDASTSTSFSSTNRTSSAQRSRGKKRGTGGRDRNRKRVPAQNSHASAGQPLKDTTGSSSQPAGSRRTDFEPGRPANPGLMNQPGSSANPSSNPQLQAETRGQGSMTSMATEAMNMGFAGAYGHSQNMYAHGGHTQFWNSTPNAAVLAQNQIMMTMMLNNLAPAIPAYNPLVPSAPNSSSANNSFQFGAQHNMQNNRGFAQPSAAGSQHLVSHQVPFQFLNNPAFPPNQPPSHTHLNPPQYDHHPSSNPSNPNPNPSHHFNPWFFTHP